MDTTLAVQCYLGPVTGIAVGYLTPENNTVYSAARTGFYELCLQADHAQIMAESMLAGACMGNHLFIAKLAVQRGAVLLREQLTNAEIWGHADVAEFLKGLMQQPLYSFIDHCLRKEFHEALNIVATQRARTEWWNKALFAACFTQSRKKMAFALKNGATQCLCPRPFKWHMAFAKVETRQEQMSRCAKQLARDAKQLARSDCCIIGGPGFVIGLGMHLTGCVIA